MSQIKAQLFTSKEDKIKTNKLSKEELNLLYDEYERTGVIPNPYRDKSIYGYFIQALINLGPNKRHNFRTVKQEIKRLMQNDYSKDNINHWELFFYKEPKDKLTAMDGNGRLMLVGTFLNRTYGQNQIGFKLKQLLACIDLLGSTDPLIVNANDYRLNTNFNRIADVNPIYTKKGRA